MNAKEYLRSIQQKKNRIDYLTEKCREIELRAILPKGIDYSRERVQTSPTGDHSANRVISLVDKKTELKDMITDYKNTVDECKQMIQALNNQDYEQVLTEIYINFKSFRQAGESLKRSASWVFKRHTLAIAEFETLHENFLFGNKGRK